MRVATAAIIAMAMVTAAEACPDWQARPAFGQIELYEGFRPDPWYRNVTAGGSYQLSNCGFSWAGWVAVAPDFDLYYRTSGRSTLTIRVESNVDTVLLINDPGGAWYFDDDSGGGSNASIRIPNARDGLYDIWIGTYARGSGIRAQLVITELD